jgi:hypothetical protein
MLDDLVLQEILTIGPAYASSVRWRCSECIEAQQMDQQDKGHNYKRVGARNQQRSKDWVRSEVKVGTGIHEKQQ